MGRSFGDPVTLTADWQDVGEVDVPVSGNYAGMSPRGHLNVRVKHVKHASQSGGYPVVRVRYKSRDKDSAAVYSHDNILDPSVTFLSGVATVQASSTEVELLDLTDSDGTVEHDLVLSVPPGKERILLQAKQDGDTTNFGTISAEVEGTL